MLKDWEQYQTENGSYQFVNEETDEFISIDYDERVDKYDVWHRPIQGSSRADKFIGAYERPQQATAVALQRVVRAEFERMYPNFQGELPDYDAYDI